MEGLDTFLRALQLADKQTKKIVRGRLRKAAEPIRQDVEERFMEYNPKSARGYRTIVRTRGITVEQRYRKKTGLRPEYTVLQVEKALDPAYFAGIGTVVLEMEHALDDIAHIWSSLPGTP